MFKRHVTGHVNPWYRRLLILITIFSLTACATLTQIIQKPTAAFDRVDFEQASLVGSTLNFYFNVTNPNPIAIRASRIAYDLKLNGQNFIHGMLDQGVRLPAQSTGHMNIPISIRYLDFFDSIADLTRRKTAAYDLTGSFDVGPFTIPFKTQGTFKLPHMPQIALQKINIEKLSLFGASLICQLRLDNPNAFALDFKRLDYSLKLGGASFGQASAQPQHAVSAKGRSIIDLAFDVSFAQIGRSAYNLLTNAKSDYQLEGRLVMDGQSGADRLFPFRTSGVVPFVR